MEDIKQRLAELHKLMAHTAGAVEFIRTRVSAYLGDQVALTFLKDETPIYVNSNDFGSPANFINGGEYEEDNFSVIRSFLRPGSVFLDIGANLGYFSIRVAKIIRRHGRVIAYEPHKGLAELIDRSFFLNGIQDCARVENFALSNQTGHVRMRFPKGHLGGGFVDTSSGTDGGSFSTHDVLVKKPDECLSNLTPDVIKIDVEGHEQSVLEGMAGTIGRSENVNILFEKLDADSKSNGFFAQFFHAQGMRLFHVVGGARLEPCTTVAGKTGYFLATRTNLLDADLDRNRFSIWPSQMNIGGAHVQSVEGAVTFDVVGPELLMYGPYSFLARGTYDITVIGNISNEIRITLAARFGYGFNVFTISGRNPTVRVAVEYDLVYFEIVFRSPKACTASIERIDFHRVG